MKANKVNISIDDVSPHPNSSTKVLERCYELISVFPEIKFSLFIPISYWRTVKPGISTTQPLQINLFPDFCNQLKLLPDENFEVCYHGFYHGIPGRSDNDEFEKLDYKNATERFKAMLHVVELAGLTDKFKMVFRPPAWRMSGDSIQAARDIGFKVLALSQKEYAKKTYGGIENLKDDVVYYNCNPPFDSLVLSEKTEIVYHACEWDKNYLSKDLSKDLLDFLSKNTNNIKFSFLEDLTKGSSQV